MNRGRLLLVVALAAIVLLGAAVRFHSLGDKGLWNDEILIARAVRLPTIGEKFFALYNEWEAAGSPYNGIAAKPPTN